MPDIVARLTPSGMSSSSSVYVELILRYTLGERTQTSQKAQVDIYVKRTDGYSSQGDFRAVMHFGSSVVTGELRYGVASANSYAHVFSGELTSDLSASGGNLAMHCIITEAPSNYLKNIGIPESNTTVGHHSYHYTSIPQGVVTSYDSVYLTFPATSTNLNAPNYCNLSKDDFQENAIFISAAWGAVGNAINNNLTNYVLQFRRRASPQAVPSDWSGDWSSIPAGTTSIPTSGIVDVGLHNGFQIRVQARGTAGASGYSAWTESNWVYNDETTPPSAPTYINASINDTTISLAWGPSTSGIHNPIQYYELIYSVGTFGNNWQTLITTTDTTYAFTTGIEKGQGMFFGVRAVGLYTASAWVHPGGSGGVYRSSDCITPTSLQASFTPTNYDTAGIFSFSSAGANSGVNNNIVGYEFQFKENLSGETWGAWTNWFTISNESTFFEHNQQVHGTVPQGQKVQFRVRTQGSAGVNYYSDWKESNIVTNPTPTNALSIVTVLLNPTINPIFFDISIRGEGAAPGVANNIIGYDVEYRHSTDGEIWDGWNIWYRISESNTHFAVENGGNIPEGGFLQLRLKTVGEAGIYRVSEWTESNIVQNDFGYVLINIMINGEWQAKPINVFVENEWKPIKNMLIKRENEWIKK